MVQGATPKPDDGDDKSVGIGPAGGLSFDLRRLDSGGPGVHLVIETDFTAEVARVVDLGARILEQRQGYTILTDPGGLVFCVVHVQHPDLFEPRNHLAVSTVIHLQGLVPACRPFVRRMLSSVCAPRHEPSDCFVTTRHGGRMRTTAKAIALTLLLLLPALGVLPSGAVEKVDGEFTASPVTPIVGERVHFTGRVPGGVARPVLLERRSDGRWHAVARKRSTPAGRFSFAASAGTVPDVSSTYRVVAPGTRIGGRAYARVATPLQSLTPMRQASTLSMPASEYANKSFTLEATFEPARLGRAVKIQVLRDDAWVTVTTLSQDSSGVARTALTGLEPGTMTYRAVALPANGAASSATASRSITIERPPRQVVAKLFPGQSLMGGDSLVSPSGSAFYQVGADGNSCVTKDGVTVWCTQTVGHPGGALKMLADGNVTLADASGTYWSTNTATFSDAYLAIDDDGGLGVYAASGKPLWQRGSQPSGEFLGDQLRPGETLSDNQMMRSQDGVYRLVMQADGNLVLYGPGDAVRWAASTNGPGRVLTMQGDGNLVVYAPGGVPAWHAITAGFPGARLVLQNDGNLVIYQGSRALWAYAAGQLYNQLQPSQVLRAGDEVRSISNMYRLIMQGDGNLVVYNSGGVAQWASHTSGSGNWAVMQGDGNLVIYSAGNSAKWSSQTAGRSGANAVMQSDGNVVLYQGGNAIWASRGVGGGGGNADALTRGRSWVDARVPYSQTQYHTNAYGTYRMDCSGYVSMMWSLGQSLTTRTLPNVSHQISKDQLAPGDILLNVTSHVVLFAGWADAGRTYYWAYEENPAGAGYNKIPYPYWSGYGTFVPYRKN